jgi:hypothetical protein
MADRVTADLVTYDQANDEYVLYLVEDGPWPQDEAGWRSRLAGIQERVLSAADVAIDGHLVEKYPDASGRKVRIQVDSPNGCPSQLESLVAAISRFLLEDASYSAAIPASPQLQGLRVVTGKQMGRFE